MGDTKALAQKLEELKIIHTKLLRDTIRAKVTELCAMHPHHTMIEITEMAGLPYTLDDIKQSVLESHMKDLHVLLHQVGSFQSKDGDRVLNWIASQLQDFIFKTVEFLYKYDMIPISMVRIFFAMGKTLEVAVYIMLERGGGKHCYVNNEINETIGFLLEKSLTVTHAHTLKVISTVLDFIIKNYQDYDVMGFSQRGSPTKEAFDLRYASLDLIEELVRINNYLHGFYHHQYNYNGSSDLILTLNGKTK
ncbi:hypothetical protein Pst134EA_004748 [Puccinia striiformis f. sp. tritici]|uniref:hypothetical protein n=1 Tax=Puccinia striiformis f. sp. tritici TaxID=168172 RepID=UPI00200899D2|nr:hypothetical protein Pst134EA_004748 [Puccinia striiformis f. sp. tritici]KAH9470830.1 hypothetical protein Pst134EA_004748 [Puccinia striiformis f. sp. tritici]